MALIDDEGNLFGVVNVVDALAVLLVLAVVVAGAALVLGEDPAPSEPDTATTYATLDLGTHQPAVADAINEGDTHDAGGNTDLTITDVYLTPRDNGVGVLVRVELQGAQTEDGAVSYGDAPLRLGRSLTIATDRYKVAGAIQSVGDADAIDRTNTRVVLRDTVPASTADHVRAGDTVTLGGRTAATVEEVATYATADPGTRRVLLAASIDAYRQEGDHWFGGTPLRVGQNLTLPTSGYVIEGPIERVGEDAELGATTTRPVTLRMDGVHQDTADAIEPGLTERTRGTTIADVTGVEVDPAPIIVTADDGSVTVADHPVERDVRIDTELTVRETSTGFQFKGEPLQRGSTIVLDLGTITVEATVASVGS